MVGSINAHRKINEYLCHDVLPSFGFFLVQIASRIGHVARYAPLSYLQFVLKNNLKI